MAGPTVHFLLVYSFDQQKLVHQEEFNDTRRATEAYSAVERQYKLRENFEVVLVGSDSIQTVMKTHGHYFRDASDSLFSDFLTSA